MNLKIICFEVHENVEYKILSHVSYTLFEHAIYCCLQRGNVFYSLRFQLPNGFIRSCRSSSEILAAE